MRKRLTLFAGLALVAVLLAACGTQTAVDEELGALAAPESFLISSANGLPANFADLVAARGDTLTSLHAGAGFASVVTANPNAYKRFADVVVRDYMFARETPLHDVEATVVTDAGYPPNSGDDDFFFDLQWGHNAVKAQEAWAAGVTGQGVRVAVLDEGFDVDHPDIAPNLNLGLSASFVPGEPTVDYLLPDTFSHGMHVAGTIAAADNGFGTIGVAPDAELVFVKVLSELLGGGAFSWIINGIVYAADVDADVINMSLGTRGLILQGSGPGSNEIAALRVAVNRAINYARQSGTTVIVSAGNDALDGDKDGSNIKFNSFAQGAISVSALAPVGWAVDPANASLDYLASYSNYGITLVDVSAPGGDFVYPGNEACTVAGLTRPCWVFDLVFSTGNGGWYWSAGTSMAAPHVAGIAALIISENGGDMHPDQLKTELFRRAADLGDPGRDPVYGHGRVTSGY